MADVRSFNAARADKAQDNSLISPLEQIEEAAEDLRSGKADATSAMVILLDRGKDGGDYNHHWYMSKLAASEAIALLEVVKAGLVRMIRGDD